MKTKEKFTALQITEKEVDGFLEPNFEYGQIKGAYYHPKYPETFFDTKRKAIEWAYKENSSAKWVILSVITFVK